MNTGIGDVSDLGWMLEALTVGWGGEVLLDAYDAERRPVAIRNSASSTSNYQGWVDNHGYADVLDPGPVGEACRREIGKRLTGSLHSEWSSLGIDLGYRYESSPVIVPDGTPEVPDDPSEYIPTARPGHARRMPGSTTEGPLWICSEPVSYCCVSGPQPCRPSGSRRRPVRPGCRCDGGDHQGGRREAVPQCTRFGAAGRPGRVARR